MQKQLLVLSPVGTSILSNCTKDQDKRNLVNKYANNKTETGIPPADVEELMALMEEAEDKLKTASFEAVARLSAELNAVIHLYGSQFHPAKNRRDHHILLSTDTWLGKRCAELACQWLNAQSVTAEVYTQPDLRTVSLDELQIAFADIVKNLCDENIRGWRDQGYHVVFNLTGGFKGIQGFLQTLASFYADETIYIFEKSELIRIPRLPVKIDADDIIKSKLIAFRRMANSLPVTDDMVAGIPETLLMSIDGQCTLSSWGELIWNQSRRNLNQGGRNLYQSEVFEPPSPRIRYTKTFLDSVKGLQPDRIAQINRRMDDLAVCLETGQKLNSLDLKALAGNPKPPSTHEADAWADLDAKRLFGHFDGKVFVIDRLDQALH